MAKLLLPKSATAQTLQLFVQSKTATDGSGATGLTATTASIQMHYSRPLATLVAVTLVTATTGATQDYKSGLLTEIGATGMKGWYRFDPPDAALASGVNHVGFHLSGATAIADLPIEIQLTDFNLNNGVNGGLTSLPTATSGATGGLALRTHLITATALNSATNLIGLATLTATHVLGQINAATNLLGLATLTATHVLGQINAATNIIGLATMTATDVLTQALAALDTAVPGSPTANSINDTVANLDAVLPTTEIASFLKVDGLETGFTMQGGFRVMFAALSGVLAGANTATITIQSPNATATRIRSTVDADGNRSARDLVPT